MALYMGKTKVQFNVPKFSEQSEPSIDVSEDGLITATIHQTPGYVTGSTKTSTKQLTTQSGITIEPAKFEQIAVASGVYTTGDVKVSAIKTGSKLVTPSAQEQLILPDANVHALSAVIVEGDANLVPENIKSGVSIFGVNGTYGSTNMEDIEALGVLCSWDITLSSDMVIVSILNSHPSYYLCCDVEYRYSITDGGEYQVIVPPDDIIHLDFYQTLIIGGIRNVRWVADAI